MPCRLLLPLPPQPFVQLPEPYCGEHIKSSQDARWKRSQPADSAPASWFGPFIAKLSHPRQHGGICWLAHCRGHCCRAARQRSRHALQLEGQPPLLLLGACAAVCRLRGGLQLAGVASAIAPGLGLADANASYHTCMCAARACHRQARTLEQTVGACGRSHSAHSAAAAAVRVSTASATWGGTAPSCAAAKPAPRQGAAARRASDISGGCPRSFIWSPLPPPAPSHSPGRPPAHLRGTAARWPAADPGPERPPPSAQSRRAGWGQSRAAGRLSPPPPRRPGRRRRCCRHLLPPRRPPHRRS